jgi:hypothetical protein
VLVDTLMNRMWQVALYEEQAPSDGVMHRRPNAVLRRRSASCSGSRTRRGEVGTLCQGGRAGGSNPESLSCPQTVSRRFRTTTGRATHCALWGESRNVYEPSSAPTGTAERPVDLGRTSWLCP